MPATPKSLRRYLVDRATGMTSEGIVHIVVLALTTDDGKELSVCMSKADAMLLAGQLQTAAIEAQKA